MSHLDGIRAVFFDAVGTVLFPDPGASLVYAEVASRHGIALEASSVSPLLWRQFRMEDDLDRERNWTTSEERERTRWRNVVSAALPGSSDELFEELFHHFARPTAWRVPDEAAETIAALHASGYVVGMGSNYDSRLRTVVDGSPELLPLRNRLVISSLVGIRKPGRAFFEAVVSTAGCRADEVLFVGDDTENDYHGAIAAGLRAVLLDEKDKHPEVPTRVRRLTELGTGTPIR